MFALLTCTLEIYMEGPFLPHHPKKKSNREHDNFRIPINTIYTETPKHLQARIKRAYN
jgi:hypothetical protein